jgi:hypothetical protein
LPGKDAWAAAPIQRLVKDAGSTVETGEPFFFLRPFRVKEIFFA